MSEKCLYCGTEIKQTLGKREKKFCKPSCCTMFHVKTKPADGEKRSPGRPKGAKNKKIPLTKIPPTVNPDEIVLPDSATITEELTISEIEKKHGKEAAKKAKKETDPKKKAPEDTDTPISLADMFKGRNVNDRTYKRPIK